MVKFANKCKGKKSNRKTISVKKTIDRNVKNHKKKLKLFFLIGVRKNI